MTLRYDATGLDPDTIGDDRGVSPDDRHSLRSRLADALAAVEGLRERGEQGFLDCPDHDPSDLVGWAGQKRRGMTDQVVIGIGGSSLGALAVLSTVRDDRLEGLRTHFAENVDPVEFSRLLDRLDLSTTILVVISKSGSTIETMSKFWIVYDRLIEQMGEEAAADHVVAITDPREGGLRRLVDEQGFDAFPVPSDVGGRFSVLTPVGLVPLALAGYPVDRLLDGARQARQAALVDTVADNALLGAAADIFTLYERGVDQLVMMAYSSQLIDLADWFRQLWAESLGKAHDRQGNAVHVGMTPVKALGVIDQHSQVQLYMEGPNDKHIVFLEVERFDDDLRVPERKGLPESLGHLHGKSLSEIMGAELQGTRRALQEAGRPTTSWVFGRVSPEAVGGFILSWEFITAVVGELLDINAFDQPGVELGKKIAHGLLGRHGFDEWRELGQGGGGDTGRQAVVVSDAKS